MCGTALAFLKTILQNKSDHVVTPFLQKCALNKMYIIRNLERADIPADAYTFCTISIHDISELIDISRAATQRFES